MHCLHWLATGCDGKTTRGVGCEKQPRRDNEQFKQKDYKNEIYGHRQAAVVERGFERNLARYKNF